MRLLVSCIPYDGGKSGISVYVREVVRELVRQGHELTLLLEPQENGADDSWRRGIPAVFAPGWTRRPALSMLWHLFRLPSLVKRGRFGEFDAMVICAANRRVCSSYPLPTVATVHDLANFHIPGKYSRLRMLYLRTVLPHYAKRAQHLVAVSGATKSDMVRYWGCRDEDVTVLYNGLPPAKAAETPRGGSILYISRIEHPGKNHVRLVEAYSRLPLETAAAHPLVLAGADWKDAEAVHSAVAASPYAEFIRMTGFVPDGEMEKLWREAGFYVFPSLFEGFGLSLAEAMARGIPCACSENGSLGEVGGDAAVKFDPNDTGSIFAALETLLGEDDRNRRARIERGLERVKAFSWSAHAEGMVRLLERKRAASVFGIRIDCDTNAKAVEALREGGGRAFAFVNAHCLNVAFRDREYHEILGTVFSKVWPDGVGVRMAGRKLGFDVPENVNGTDLIPMAAEGGGLSFWFLGGKPGVAEEALRRCKERFPDSRFLGCTDGYRKDWSGAIAEIAAARPDVLLVAMGVPLQEKWIAGHKTSLANVGSIVAVGGLLDFMSGRIPRAPLFVRRCSLEWAWRLAMEPCRMFKRYVVGNFLFLYRVACEARGRRCR